MGTQDGEEWRLFDIDDWHPEGRRLNAAEAASFCADIKVFTSNRHPELTYCGDWRVSRAVALYTHKAIASRERLESMVAAFLADDPDYLTYEDRWQADLLRCIFGNPFAPLAADTPNVEPRIREMADSIYRLRAFDKMPDLGKLLVTSGCVAPDLVTHC
jgi:hypothetical protein